MKQPEDTKTIDMLDPAKAKPGRPQKAAKLTAAQRQEARRARLRAAGKGFITATVDATIIERIDAIHTQTGADKNTIVESLLRQALAAQATEPRRARKGGEAAR